MIDWGALVAPALLLLVVPAAIVAARLIPAYLRANGAIIVSAMLATISFAVFWLVLGGVNPITMNELPYIVTLYSGTLLTLSAWVLAMNAAVQTRRWLWFIAVGLAGYLTLAAIYASFSVQSCIQFQAAFNCPPPNPLLHALLTVGYLVCPLTAFVFALRRPGNRVRELPEGLVGTPLRAADTTEVDETANAD
jgi:hypothetical protein